MNGAEYELVREYRSKNGTLAQFNLAALSHYSYILSSKPEALLVDPGRETDVYAEYLERNKLVLKGIFLTHSHADFVAGHLEAAQRFDAPVFISRAAGAQYRHHPLHDEESLELGAINIRFLSTPGHTLDGMCALIEENGEPRWLLTGDTLFVGSVGRPDLMGGMMSAAELAAHAYRSWREKLSILPDDLRFFPAHGAGSLCGANLKNAPFSAIGEEKHGNVFLQVKSRNEFIAKMLNSLPDTPRYFAFDAAMNRRGPDLVDWNAPVAAASPEELENAFIIDLRDRRRYAEGHLPKSVNIGLDGRFENWTGIIVPPDIHPVLVADTEEELRQGVRRLHRIGYVARGIRYTEIAEAGITLRKSGFLEPAELAEIMRNPDAPLVVDVRNPAEFAGVRIGEIVNLPLNHLESSCSKLNADEPVVTVCHSAYRASLALGILERAGFSDLATLAGGTEAWIEAGLPTLYGTGESQATTSCKIR